jgi:hypothetical protein
MMINKKLHSIQFNIEFDDKDQFWLFQSPSGTGKTFLFRILQSYGENNDINIKLIDSNIFKTVGDLQIIENICLEDSVRIVILDNADLYLNNDFIEELSKTDKKVIISYKNNENFYIDNNYSFYTITYEGNVLDVRRC